MNQTALYKTDHFFFVNDDGINNASNLPAIIIKKIYSQYKKGVEQYNAEGFTVRVMESASGEFFYVKPMQATEGFNPLLITILNSISEGITVSDNKGKIFYQNDVDLELVGINCMNRSVQDLVAEGKISESITLKVLESKETATIIQSFLTDKCFLVTGKPIFDEAGDVQYVIAITRDMTQLKALEEEVTKLELQNENFKQKIHSLIEVKPSIIATSPAMQQVINRVMRVAAVDSTILIEGESGVGKEEITKLIHLNSRRSTKQILTINCSAIPETLLEAELFGYEAGAFTGAIKGGRAGLFEIASGGTIFLDEIGEMPLQLQSKLLRVLQESEVQRIGSSQPIPIDVRIIAATNRNLMQMVQEGTFREDLYYRLNIIPIEIPPLRERREEIVPLTYHFLTMIKEKYNIHCQMNKHALKILEQYDWPGNVRQLKNMIERLSLLTDEAEISVSMVMKELKDTVKMGDSPMQSPSNTVINMDVAGFSGTLKEQVALFEKQVIKKALSEHPSIRQAAKALGCDQSTLVRKINRYQLTKQVHYD